MIKGMAHGDRREFLQRLAVLVGATGVARGGAAPLTEVFRSVAREAAGRRRHLDRIGIQIYTVRSLMPHDPDGTLAALAGIGYTEVEMAGLYGIPAATMRQMLDRHGLTAVSGHVPLKAMRQDWSRALDDAAALGQHYIVCSSIDEAERTPDGFRRAAEELNRLAESARSHGLQFGYHNHNYEFTAVGGAVPYEILLTRTDPKLVQMEVDLMWMVKGGGDPVAYFNRYPGRFPMVHVKDMTRDGVMVDVGRGSIDFPAIFSHADQAGIKHFFVEHDEPPNPVADARVCYDYLRQLTF